MFLTMYLCIIYLYIYIIYFEYLYSSTSMSISTYIHTHTYIYTYLLFIEYMYLCMYSFIFIFFICLYHSLLHAPCNFKTTSDIQISYVLRTFPCAAPITRRGRCCFAALDIKVVLHICHALLDRED